MVSYQYHISAQTRISLKRVSYLRSGVQCPARQALHPSCRDTTMFLGPERLEVGRHVWRGKNQNESGRLFLSGHYCEYFALFYATCNFTRLRERRKKRRYSAEVFPQIRCASFKCPNHCSVSARCSCWASCQYPSHAHSHHSSILCKLGVCRHGTTTRCSIGVQLKMRVPVSKLVQSESPSTS